MSGRACTIQGRGLKFQGVQKSVQDWPLNFCLEKDSLILRAFWGPSYAPLSQGQIDRTTFEWILHFHFYQDKNYWYKGAFFLCKSNARLTIQGSLDGGNLDPTTHGTRWWKDHVCGGHVSNLSPNPLYPIYKVDPSSNSPINSNCYKLIGFSDMGGGGLNFGLVHKWAPYATSH